MGEAAEPGRQQEVEIANNLLRSTLRAAIAAITNGASEKGHWRLTVEFQDGEVRRAFCEHGPIGGAELVKA